MASDVAKELAQLLSKKAQRNSEPDLVHFFEVEIDNALNAEVAKAQQIARDERDRVRQEADGERAILNDQIRSLVGQLNAARNPSADPT